jgi:hypothetical protein
MTAYYVKANERVYGRFAFSDGERVKTSDGCYILWQADLVKLGAELGIAMGFDFEAYVKQVAESVGALLLTAKEAKEEQDGRRLRTLPVATMDEFITDEQRAAIIEAEAEQADEAAAEEEEETNEGKEAEDEPGVD